MIVIGLSGLSRSGKDSVADILVRDYGFEKRSFAGPLKRVTREVDPILAGGDGFDYHLSDAILDGLTEDEIKERYPEYVRFLKKLGTEGIRYYDDDFWINAAKKSLTDPDGKYVFTDVRFPNEAQMIYDTNKRGPWSDAEDNHTADVWHVTRPGISLPEGAHISEQHAGKMGETVEIHNNASLEMLKDTVDIAMNFVNAPVRWMSGFRLTDEQVAWESEGMGG